MLIVETIARIRRDHLGPGVPIKQIARDLKLSRKTVREGKARREHLSLVRMYEELAAFSRVLRQDIGPTGGATIGGGL